MVDCCLCLVRQDLIKMIEADKDALGTLSFRAVRNGLLRRNGSGASFPFCRNGLQGALNGFAGLYAWAALEDHEVNHLTGTEFEEVFG